MLIDLKCRHHMFSSDMTYNHAKRKVFGMRVFLEYVKSWVLFCNLWCFGILGRRVELVSILMERRLFIGTVKWHILLVMNQWHFLFGGRELEIFRFRTGFGLWLFAPFYLLLVFCSFWINDEFEELNDFLVFSFVIENHFEKFRELNFSWLVLVNRVNELFDLFSGFH